MNIDMQIVRNSLILISSIWGKALMEILRELNDCRISALKKAWLTFIRSNVFRGEIIGEGYPPCCTESDEGQGHCIALIPMTLNTLNKIIKENRPEPLYNIISKLSGNNYYGKVLIIIVLSNSTLRFILEQDLRSSSQSNDDSSVNRLEIVMNILEAVNDNTKNEFKKKFNSSHKLKIIDARKIELALIYSFFTTTLPLSSVLELFPILKESDPLEKVIDSLAINTSLFIARHIIYPCYKPCAINIYIGENRLAEEHRRLCIKLVKAW